MHKNLFHIDQKNAIQFVTFRTQESVAYYLEKHSVNTKDSIARQQLKIDQFLDTANAGAVLNGEVIALLLTFFTSKNADYYHLLAVSIMPNHIHLLFEQRQPIATIMHKIKGATASLINKHYKRTGIFWDKGYFDKVVRTEKQFQITYQYIKNNAYSARLKDADKRFYGVYEDRN